MPTTPAAALVLAAALLAVAGCTSATDENGNSGIGPDATSPPPTAASPSGGARHRPVPDLVGRSLHTARRGARRSGFTRVAPHDALRRRRTARERDWRVCAQRPRAGHRAAPGTRIEVAVVRDGEACP